MTMIKKLAVLATATAAFAATPAAAQDASDSTGTASVNIVSPMTLTKQADLDFGTVILGAAGWASGSVQVDDADARSCVTVVCTDAIGASAEYLLEATGDTTVSVSIPDTVEIALTTDNTKKLTVDLEPELASSITGTTNYDDSVADVYTFTMDSSGSQTLKFGGSIDLVEGSVQDGLYTGPFTVTADYN